MATARFDEEYHYIVLLGDVGTGKSTLVEKISGETGISSSQSTSCTKVSVIYESFDKRIVICDTPGSNAMCVNTRLVLFQSLTSLHGSAGSL